MANGPEFLERSWCSSCSCVFRCTARTASHTRYVRYDDVEPREVHRNTQEHEEHHDRSRNSGPFAIPRGVVAPHLNGQQGIILIGIRYSLLGLIIGDKR